MGISLSSPVETQHISGSHVLKRMKKEKVSKLFGQL